MVQRYPAGDDFPADQVAEEELEFLSGIIRAVRNLRTEMNVPPSRKVAVVLFDTEERLSLVRAHESMVCTLARTEPLEYLSQGVRPKKVATAIVDTTEVYVPLDGAVDLEEEGNRLCRALGKIETELDRVRKKLDNENFTARARAEVVEREREKAQEMKRRSKPSTTASGESGSCRPDNRAARGSRARVPAMSSAEHHSGRPLHDGLTVARIVEDLGTKRLGSRIDVYPELASTNRTAHALAEAGEPEGAVVIAEAQTRGQGRLGRQWVSPPELNLYISFVLRPRLDPAEAAKITLLAAVAVADTLKDQVPCRPRIKWPNDVLLRGRKVAGILSELACEPGRTLFVIVGIGINLNFPRGRMSPDLRSRATSVMEEAGAPVDRVLVTRSLVRNLENRYIEFEEHGFGPIARKWNGYARMEGRWVRARTAGEEWVGRVRMLDGDGFLVLECRDGRTERVVSGDVFLLQGAP